VPPHGSASVSEYTAIFELGRAFDYKLFCCHKKIPGDISNDWRVITLTNRQTDRHTYIQTNSTENNTTFATLCCTAANKRWQTRCAHSESKNSPRSLHCRGETRWRPLASTNVSYQAVSRNVNRSGNVIVHPHRDSDQHQTLVASRGSTLARVYHVWRTFVNAFVSYPAHSMTNRHIDIQTDRQTDRQTSKQHRSHNSALTE